MRPLPALACLVLAAAPGRAQQLTGSLRALADSQPVAGALVVLTDSAARPVAQTVSSERGLFTFRMPAPGRYRVRVLRIGHQPWESDPFDARTARRLTLWVDARPVMLAAITVEARRNRCGAPPPASLLGQLLDEAQKALALTQATLDERRIVFELEVWRRRLSAEAITIDSVGVRSTGGGWPIRSADPESLRVWGFVRQEPDDAGAPATTYYGPDARVLFADWFVASRCLRLREADRRTPGLLTVEFTPADRRPGADIAGEFVFDSASLELRELRWHWRNLPGWVPRAGPGGYVRFQRQPAGEWLPTGWSLRAPVAEVNPRGEIRVAHYLESGGLVTRVRAPRP